MLNRFTGWFTRKGSKPRVEDLQLSLSSQEAKRRCRILIIDDQPEGFPIELLKAEDYQIEHWPKVDKGGIRKLEEGHYDIIVLDIAGVASEWGAEDGIGVLKDIKKHNPKQIVVAYSGQTFKLDKTQFFKLADDVLSKPADAFACKELLDDIMASKFTVSYYWATVEAFLQQSGASADDIDRINLATAAALTKQPGANWQDTIRQVLSRAESVGTVLTLVGKIVENWSRAG